MKEFESVKVSGGGKRPTTHKIVLDSEKMLKYLADTDWFIVRNTEIGVDVPPEVLAKRKFCRDNL